MRIFQDVFSGAQLLSDSYKIQQLFEKVIGQVKSRMVVKKQGEVDIGCGNAFGGNNQDQQQGGNGEAPPEKVIDLVDAFQYGETSMDKASFGTYFKGYVQKLLPWLTTNRPQRVADFKVGAKAFLDFVKSRFDDFSFWCPSDYDIENLIILSYYKNEQDQSPTFLYIMDGFKSYKV